MAREPFSLFYPPHTFISIWNHALILLSDYCLLLFHESKCSILCVCVCVCVRAPSVTKSCPTLFDLMDCSVPGSSDHGISQTKILWWVAIFSSKGSSQPRDWTCVSCIGRWILYPWATRLVAHKSPEITLNINKYILDEWVNVGKTP